MFCIQISTIPPSFDISHIVRPFLVKYLFPCCTNHIDRYFFPASWWWHRFNVLALVSPLCHFPDPCKFRESQLDSVAHFLFIALSWESSFNQLVRMATVSNISWEGGMHVKKKIYSFESQIHPRVLSHPPGFWLPFSVAKSFIGG